MIKENGDVVAFYEYTPFGKLINSQGDYANKNPIRFSSEYWDNETELIYYNYRYYDPQLGRWLSRDPSAEKGGLNIYGFVNNNPINKFDVLGLWERFPFPTPGDIAPQRAAQENAAKERQKRYQKWRDWLKKEKKKIYDEDGNIKDDAWINGLTPCPPKLPKVYNYNPGLTPGGYSQTYGTPPGWSSGIWFPFTRDKYHPGGQYEIRGGGGPAAAAGHGNQCIYDKCGNLITSRPTAGTADWNSPGFFGSSEHMDNDVYPYDWAKEFGEEEEYYEARPHVWQDSDGNVYVNDTPTDKNYTTQGNQ